MIDPKNSEGQRDRDAFAAADAAAKLLGKTTGADALVGGRAKGWGVTPPGAACDTEGIRIDTDPTPPLERLPSRAVDGHAVSASPLDLSDPNTESPFRAAYDVARHDQITNEHAATLTRSGKPGVTTVPKV